MKPKVNTNLRFKVTAGFGILAIIIMVVVLVSFLNFKRLFHSVEFLSKPEQKEEVLNKIYEDVSASLKNIRLYGLTGKSDYYNIYLDKTSEIKEQVDILKEKDYIFSYKPQIDSLENLLALKGKSASNLKQLITKRKTMYSSLDDIRLQSDTVYYPSIEVETTRVEYIKAIPIKKEVKKVVSKPEKKGFFRRLFSFKNKNEVATKEENKPRVKYVKSSKIHIDTTMLVKAIPYSNIKEVRKQLNSWGWRNKQIDNIITKEEEDLLHNHDAFTQVIKEILMDLREKEKSEKENNIQKANHVIKKSTFTIGLIGISGVAGCIFFLILISKDIRLSNIYKSKLAREKRRAVQIARNKDKFLTNMSHEIRTPLGAIIGFSEQLDKAPLAPEQKKYLSAIRNSSDHLLSLVNDILDLSKIEAGKMSIEKVSFTLSKVARDVYQNLKIKADEKNLKFFYELDECLKCELRGDPFRLKQILFNLIGNAIKFTYQGCVEFNIKKFSEGPESVVVQIDVIDTGLGIPANKQASIFNQFEQASESDSRKFGGTGLGLSISKNLIQNMGGSIMLESETNKGTKFTVVLPFEKLNVAENLATAYVVPNNQISLKGKRILIVEDDPYITLLMKIIFLKHQMLAVFADSGKEGYRKFKDSNFDLVITDMQLPELSGIDLIRTIRKEFPEKGKNIPVILCSANVLNVQKFQDLYKINFLVKPFKEQELINILASALAGPDDGPMENPEWFMERVKSRTKNYSTNILKEIVKDSNDLNSLLSKIVENGRKSVQELKEATLTLNEDKIREISHKLLPAFTQLQATQVVNQLEKVHSQRSSSESVFSIARVLLPILSKLLDEIENDIETKEEKELATINPQLN